VFDIAIIGGGIIGLGTALALAERFPRYSLAIAEKEPELASHQTGHNSGVIHAGIYYKPGSYKARLCVEGVRLLKAFCEANGVPYDNCGKVIVAASVEELQGLQALFERGVANGIEGLELIGPERVREIEPYAKALRAIYSPSTAIVDFKEVAEAMARKLAGHEVHFVKSAPVQKIRRSDGQLYLETPRGTVVARHLINCGGLHSDSIARLMGVEPQVLIIPFRGEYYTLRPECQLVRGLIYPVPDPEFPFLGVHFTKRIRGPYEAGPNAVLAFAREGYRKRDISLRESAVMFAYPGFWAMARRYWRTGMYEMYRSVSRAAFLRALRRLVPELRDADLAPGGSGVRAQCVARDGSLVDDFKIVQVPNAIHILNAPSPAATASLAIGKYVAGLASASFGLQ